MKKLLSLALLALSATGTAAQAPNPTTLRQGILRGNAVSQVCLFVRSATICDPYATVNNSSGQFTLAASSLPLPTLTTIGGVQAGACAATNFVNGLGVDGKLTCAIPAGGGGGGSPGGSSGQLQVNSSGAFGGVTPGGDLSFNAGTGAFTIASGAITSAKMASGAAAGNLGFAPLNPANNLSDVGSITTARTNLGLGTVATLNSVAAGNLAVGAAAGNLGFTPLNPANNLTDLASATTARNNLGAAKSGANTDILSLGGLTGNIALTATGQRLTGDMSNATLANRFAFQTNVANGATSVNAIPNGSGSVGAFVAYSTAGMTNGNTGGFIQIGNESQLIADKIGTGAYGPLEFFTGGVERARFLAGGNFGIGNTNPAYSLDVVGDINVTGTLRVNGTPFSTGLAHSGANIDITGLSNLSSGLTVLSGSALNFNALGNTSGQRRAFIQEDASGRLAFAFTSDDGATLQSVGYINRDGSSTFGGGTTFAGLSDKTTYFPGVSTNVEATGTPGLDMAGCTTAASCGWFLFATPTAYPAAQTPPLRIDKHFPASGGTTGFTYNGLQVNTYTGLNDPSFVWGMQSVVYNNSLASTAAQQVATTGSIFKILGSQASGTNMSPSFGVFGECRDQTSAVNPTTGCGGAEFDTSSNVGSGTDTNKQRYGIHIVGGVIGGTDTGVHVGGGLIILSGAEGAQIDAAVRFATGGGAAFGVGIDFTGAGSFFGNGAILLSAPNQQVIGWTDNSGAKDGTHGFSNFAASDNNWYWDNNSNTSTVFRGQSGDTRLTMTTSVVTISKTLNLGYSGSGPPGCTATGSIPIQINGAAHQLPYC